MRWSDRMGLWRRAFGRGVFPHQMTWFLDLPGRGLILSARTVAGRLPLTPDAQVLEVGPGSGFFSVEVARRVPDGALTLLDVQPEMLAKCRARLSAAGFDDVTTVPTDGRSMPFADETFDVVYLVTVFGEIEDQDGFLREAARVLRPGGVLSITEHHPDPDFEPAAEVAEKVRRYGLVPGQPIGWRWAYTLHATKLAPDPAAGAPGR